MKMQIIETSCDRRKLELERVKNYFKSNGYDIAQDDFELDPEADVILVSTCGFTQAAEDFSLKTIDRINREKKKTAKVIVGGCLPKIAPEKVEGYQLFNPRNYEIIKEYMGFENELFEFPIPNTVGQWGLPTAYREHGRMESNSADLDLDGQKTKNENYDAVRSISETVGTNDVFRIQCLQGCACQCTYCAIKFAIGKVKSRPISDIVDEVKIAIEKGYSKICLDSDSLGCYGVDNGSNLGELLDAIIPVIENEEVVMDLPDVSPMYLNFCYKQIMKLVSLGKLHVFYIPIQSGSQKVLDLMKRGYDIKKTVDIISEISQKTDLALGTSIIVGFPGETEADLDETINMCKRIEFKYIYCHSFSARKGTPAAKLPDHVDEKEILRRARYFKSQVKEYCDYITIAEDTKGNKTCQG